jgi:uncharacterized membrane protein
VKPRVRTGNRFMWVLIGVIEAVALITFCWLSLRANGSL